MKERYANRNTGLMLPIVPHRRALPVADRRDLADAVSAGKWRALCRRGRCAVHTSWGIEQEIQEIN